MIDLFRNPMVAYFIIKKRREKSLLGILGIKIKTYTLAMNQIMVYNVKQFELKLNKFLVKTVQYYNIIKIKKARISVLIKPKSKWYVTGDLGFCLIFYFFLLFVNIFQIVQKLTFI